MARVTSTTAGRIGLGLTLLVAMPLALAEDSTCPQPAVATIPTGTEEAGTEPDPRDSQATIDGDRIEYNLNGNAVLSGNVEMRQGKRVIRADHLEYDTKDQRAKLEGGVEFIDPVFRVRGNSGSYSAVLGAQFEGAEFELPERGARGAARSLQMDTAGKITLDEVSFSTCPMEDMSWQMRARSIELDTRSRNGVGRGTSVRFKNVPIVYLPWMTFPIGSQRKSGFLFPNVGGSSRNGAMLEVPYYWNIRPNVDFTAQPVYYSKRGVDFAGELRYLTDRQRGQFEFNYLPGDDKFGEDRTRLYLEHVAELPGDWRFRIDATDVSDTQYFEDFARGPDGTSIPFAERLAEFIYRDEHLNVRGQIQDFQTIDDDLDPLDRPYTRAPRILASGDWNLGLGDIDYGFDAELVNFERNVGVTGWRLDVAPRAGFDWSGPGFFVRPAAGFRYTQYDLKDQEPGTDDAPSRSLPFASLDAGLVFERASGSHGQRRMTLEPRALYLYTPYRDQSELPLFDTGLPDLNLVQLYRNNRYVGADRVNDANQIAFGLTSRLFDAESGAQYIAASIGQVYYFDRPRVVLPTETPSARDTSDFIAQVSLTAYKNWNLEAGIQWNPEEDRSERSQFRLQYRPGPDRVVNLGYRAQRDRIEQVDVSSAWPIGERWGAYGRWVYSLRDRDTLDQFAGFEYKACCYALRAVARRFISNRDGERETAFFIQLELKGLASVGTPADAFLERAIRGYSPETSAR